MYKVEVFSTEILWTFEECIKVFQKPFINSLKKTPEMIILILFTKIDQNFQLDSDIILRKIHKAISHSITLLMSN